MTLDNVIDTVETATRMGTDDARALADKLACRVRAIKMLAEAADGFLVVCPYRQF